MSFVPDRQARWRSRCVNARPTVGVRPHFNDRLCSETEQIDGDFTMSIQMTERDLTKFGLAIDPESPTQAIPIRDMTEVVPDESWDLERLATYASTGLSEADRLQKEALRIGRNSTLQIFRAGRALWFARERLKADGRGRWGRWQEENGFKRTTVWEAIELYERAKSEGAVMDLTPSEAKQTFGVTGQPKGDAAVSRERPDARRRVGRDRTVASVVEETPLDEVEGEREDEPDRLARVSADIADDSTGAGEETPTVDPEALKETLRRIVQRLRYAEDEIGSLGGEPALDDDLLGSIDEAIEVLGRIRGKATTHAA